jgi:hypothetical protein
MAYPGQPGPYNGFEGESQFGGYQHIQQPQQAFANPVQGPMNGYPYQAAPAHYGNQAAYAQQQQQYMLPLQYSPPSHQFVPQQQIPQQAYPAWNTVQPSQLHTNHFQQQGNYAQTQANIPHIQAMSAYGHLQQFQDPPPLPRNPSQPEVQTPVNLSNTPVLVSQNLTPAPAPISYPNLKVESLLPVFAEEFFEEAHKMSEACSAEFDPDQVDVYNKLIASGLGCLESALRHTKMDPRTEAKITLRYAGVMYDETENNTEAETVLSKGIALCARNHLFDLKYNMQLLMARWLFRKSPKMALKSLDQYAADSQA